MRTYVRARFSKGFLRWSQGSENPLFFPTSMKCDDLQKAMPLKPHFISVLCRSVPIASVLVLATTAPSLADPKYGWHTAHVSNQPTLSQSIAPPPGYQRQEMPAASWATWLRGLPMKPQGSPVLLYTGGRKWRQDVHVGVVDIDIGKRDLQQCADAIMRLRAEWLYSRKKTKRIAFNNTKGKPMVFHRSKTRPYTSFRKYMTRVFAYAGTYSLERELKPKRVKDVAIGDVFIKGGFPGHAILVVDVATNPTTGQQKFLLLQSYMPAQDMHILKNPNDPSGGPWYDVVSGARLVTPEWKFAEDALRTWPSGS